jgi:superfamily II DNA or RNA helicase
MGIDVVYNTILNNYFDECWPWQKEALKALQKAKGHGIVVAPTGSGKTRVALAHLLKNYFSKKKALIIVPTKVLMNQWYKQLGEINEKYKMRMVVNKIYGESDDELGVVDIDIAVINSLRFTILEHPLMVLDEVHRYASEVNGTVLQEDISFYERIIGLTATLTRSDGKHNKLKEKVPIVYTYTVKQAKEQKVVNDYKIVNKMVYLTGEEEEKYKECNSNVKDKLGYFNGNFNKAVVMVKTSKYPANVKAGQLLKAVGTRKQLLLNCENRSYEAVKLIKQHLNDKIIVFSENIKSVEKILTELEAENIPVSIYHSKKKKRDAEIERFNSGESNILLSAKALDEGYDIKDANVGIVVSGSSSKRQIIQRLGRVIRKSEGKKTSLLYQLYVPGTVDEKWLIKRLIK